MKLHHCLRSSASWRVRIALAVKGLDCDHLAVHLPEREHLADDFSAWSASRLVPLLEDGDARLSQSLAIIEHFEAGPRRCTTPRTTPRTMRRSSA
jgi:glutathione S-transferase